MPFPTIPKSPAANLNYGFDWGTRGWLNTGETITEAAWTVPAGLTLEGSAILEGTKTVCRISGGVHGTDYEISCHVTTSEGNEDERTILLRVRRR